MLSGATASAFAMAGTAVFRIVVSSDSMKKATATSHGNNRFTDLPGAAGRTATALESAGIILPSADYLVVLHFQFRLVFPMRERIRLNRWRTLVQTAAGPQH